MATVIYNSKRIIPAPFVSISRSSQTSGDGTQVGAVFQITITGKIVAWSGSPTSSGTLWVSSGYPPDSRSEPTYIESLTHDEHFAAILRGQEAIRNLFAEEGKSLEWQALNGSAPMKCNPRNFNISFGEGQWFQLLDYTITCECDVLYINGTAVGEYNFDQQISSASESWSFESTGEEYTGIPATYRVSHTVSAQGKRFYDDTGALSMEAWKQAQAWVLPRLGFDSTIALSSGVNNLPTYYNGYNHVRTEQIDELGGNFSVTESWVVASGTATESFEVSTQSSESSPFVSVSINGTITGFDQRDSNMTITTQKLTNAETKWAEVQNLLYGRASTIAGHNALNLTPLSTSVGKNPLQGTITYTYQYDDRPSRSITGTVSEDFNLNQQWNVDVVASVGVLGRTLGPVLQDIGSHNATTRGIQMELVFGSGYMPSGLTWIEMVNDYNPRFKSPQKEEIQAIIDGIYPVGKAINNKGSTATVAYITSQNEIWKPKERRYTYNVEWVYE